MTIKIDATDDIGNVDCCNKKDSKDCVEIVMTSHGADNDKYYLGIIQVIMFFCCNCYPKEDGEKMFTNVF